MRTIGIEEEFLLVAEDGTPCAVAGAVLRHAAQHSEPRAVDATPGGVLEKEFTQEQVETSTHPCTGVEDLLREVRAGRAHADASAQSAGTRIAALATAPQVIDPTVIVNRRARMIRDVFGQVAREQLTCGCHVHVGVDDDEEGIVVIDHMRRWAPVLMALSANSPFWQGHDTDYASFRSQVWGRWPTAGPTEPFGDAATYHRLVDTLLHSGTILDVGMVYFDARLSARYPTVEVRVPDVSLDAADAVLLGSLIRALADTAVTARALDPSGIHSPPQPRTELVRIAAWRAGRSGLTGELLSPRTGARRPAIDVVRELVDHVSAALEQSGDLDWVRTQIGELFARGNGAVQQRRWRRAGASDGQLVALAIERTLT